MKNYCFSLFKGGIKTTLPTKTISLSELYKLIILENCEIITKIRNESDKKIRNSLKTTLDYVTICGTFSKRNAKGLINYSGLICLDYDDVTNIEVSKELLSKDEYTALLFTSPSANGLKVVCKINSINIREAWLQISEHFKNKYQIEADPSGKDVSRACYLSFDTEAYLNLESKEFQVDLMNVSNQKTLSKSDFERASIVVNRIIEQNIDISLGYTNWLNLGFALAIFGESGRELFHNISKQNNQYDLKVCDSKFDECLKSTKFTNAAYFFSKAKDFNINILKSNSESREREKIITNSKTISNSEVTYDLQNFETVVRQGKSEIKITEGFLIFIKYQTTDEYERIFWLLEIKKPAEDDLFITISHDDLFEPKAIEKILGIYKLCISLSPSLLQKFRKFLFTSTSFPSAKSILRYGLEPESEFYFFANVAISKCGKILKPDIHGIINSGKFHFRVPNFQKKVVSPFTYVDNANSFDFWYQLFSKAQTERISLLSVGFMMFSIFRDIGLSVNNFSPIFFITGKAGSGKSTTFVHQNYIFGEDGKAMGINLKGKNTEAAVVAKMEQRYNGYQFCDEYYPNHPLTANFQASYDNKSYSKLNQLSENHIDTIDLVPKCTIGIASNFLPELPADEPFFSRLVIIINNNLKPTNEQKEAYQKLLILEQSGLTNVLREIWQYRDLIKSEFKSNFLELKKHFETELKVYDISNHRYILNVCQILTITYIFAKNQIFQICEFTAKEDILNYFFETTKHSIFTSNSLAMEKSSLQEFFNVLQELHDRGQIIEGVHFRLVSNEIAFNFKRIYNKFDFEYRRLYKFDAIPPSYQNIKEELQQLFTQSETDFFRKLRFKKEFENNKDDFARDSFQVNYEIIKEKFQINFN